MGKIEKTASGKYRMRVYSAKAGCTKSFTHAKKSVVQSMADEWLKSLETRPLSEKTFAECVEDYISMKSNILSPTTVDKYRNIPKNQLSTEFLNMKLDRINGIMIQNEINNLAARYSPKTVHNAAGLISAVMRTYYPALNYKVTLPQVQKQYKEYPSAAEVLSWFKDTPIELLVLLGIWQGFRVSEIRGLKKSDFHDGTLLIDRVIVNVGNTPIEKKAAKTVESRRKMTVPPIIQDMVDKVDGEYITKLSGESIYKRFKRVVKRHGYPDLTFHDLRHLNASIMLLLGVPDKYAMERGGWSTTSTLKRVYQETFSSEREKMDTRIDSYFENILKSDLTKI